MITHFFLTGDTHGKNIERLTNIYNSLKPEHPEEIAVIILGDAGYNFWLSNSEAKKKLDTCGMWVYCVRGNHEERPENLGYELIKDENVQGLVYLDPMNNQIRYFMDGERYIINNHSVLVIGGAYSVDKNYRLKIAPKTYFWDEQLTAKEMKYITEVVQNHNFDFVFSHTCPISWEPTDLFLNGIDQAQVDKRMEIWMEELKDKFDWGVWCFGHYHQDRIERPYAEMFFQDFEDLEDVWDRWQRYDKTGEIDWWLTKGPNYYME